MRFPWPGGPRTRAPASALRCGKGVRKVFSGETPLEMHFEGKAGVNQAEMGGKASQAVVTSGAKQGAGKGPDHCLGH